MFHPVLKRFGFLVFIFAVALFARAQQTHFIYLQTENGQSFYVKINSKVISSSSAGYLILPKLTDGDYKLSVGFPKKEFPEEDFKIVVDKNNQGFLLKNFGEKGWGLFNIQSYAVLMGGNINAVVATAKNLQDDPFSKLLANVVKDSSILEKNEPLKVQVVPVVKNDLTGINAQDPVTLKTDSVVSVAERPAAQAPGSTTDVAGKTAPQLVFPALRFLNKKNKDGREMIYVDHSPGLNDTIRLFIPVRKPVVKTNTTDTGDTQNKLLSVSPTENGSGVTGSNIAQSVQPSIPAVTDSTSMIVAENKVEDKIPAADTTTAKMPEQPLTSASADTTLVVPSAAKNMAENNDTPVLKKVDEGIQPEIKPGETTQPVTRQEIDKTGESKKDDIVVLPRVVESSAINSDCKSFATNEDFLKLRKKMAAENSDDNMIKIAKKAFHVKCFSTEQVKNISFLFLTNAGKYMFFDLAYPFVSDSEQYKALESQLSDSYYINRFKAMIHK